MGDPDTVPSTGLPQSAVGAPAAEIKEKHLMLVQVRAGRQDLPAYPVCLVTQSCLTL